MQRVKKVTLISLAILVVSCASQKSLLEEKPIQQALVEDLVMQVRLALSAVSKRYNYDGNDLPLRLTLKKAEVKVSTAVEMVNGGKAKLVVFSGGATNTNKNENYILLTMIAPSSTASTIELSTIADKVLSREKLSYVDEALKAINSLDLAVSDVSDIKCLEDATNVIGVDSQVENQFWADVAALTAAAADGYLCAALASDTLPIDLETLEVNVAFTVTDKSEGGLQFKIWKLELGRTASAEALSGNSITMVFDAS